MLLKVTYRQEKRPHQRKQRRGDKVVVRGYYKGFDLRGHLFLTGRGLIAVPEKRLLEVEE